MKTSLAYDKAVSFRWHDQDGRLHVDRSNLTRVQVAPYRGAEIPGCEELHLSPTKIYYGFRPPEELGDEETVKSVIGIPIQLNHRLDYPDAPAMDTRVGSTGDQARFDGTFLSNSLHFQNESACRRIRDGSMKELTTPISIRRASTTASTTISRCGISGGSTSRSWKKGAQGLPASSRIMPWRR